MTEAGDGGIGVDFWRYHLLAYGSGKSEGWCPREYGERHSEKGGEKAANSRGEHLGSSKKAIRIRRLLQREATGDG